MDSQSNPYESPKIPSVPINRIEKSALKKRVPWYLRLSAIGGWVFMFASTAAYLSPPMMISDSGGRAQKLTGLADHSLLLPIGFFFICAFVSQILIYDYRKSNFPK